jgi:hypothetical protein
MIQTRTHMLMRMENLAPDLPSVKCETPPLLTTRSLVKEVFLQLPLHGDEGTKERTTYQVTQPVEINVLLQKL